MPTKPATQHPEGEALHSFLACCRGILKGPKMTFFIHFLLTASFVSTAPALEITALRDGIRGGAGRDRAQARPRDAPIIL